MSSEDELKASIVSTLSILAEGQRQFAEFQALFAEKLTAQSDAAIKTNASMTVPPGLSPVVPVNAFKFTPFDESVESFTDFVDRLESFFRLQNVNEVQKAGCLVTALSPKLFKLLKDLLYPETHASKSYEDIKKVLKEHLNPVPLVIPSRHALFTRRQAEGESITEYLTELQRLATHCKYNSEMLAIVLRDVFVSGLRSRTTLDRLFQEDDPTLQDVVKIAHSIERAEGATHNVLNFIPTSMAPVNVTNPVTNPDATSVNLVRPSTEQPSKGPSWRRNTRRPVSANKPSPSPTSPPIATATAPNVTCFSCGETGHRRPECKRTDLRCSYCGREKHVEAVCLKKRQQQQASVKQLEETSDNIDDFPYDDYALYKVEDASAADDKIFVQVRVEQEPVIFELDSGSKRTLINAATFATLKSTVCVNPVNTRLHDYNGNVVHIVGEARVKVADKRTSVPELPLLVVQDRPNVIGRDWLSALGWLTESTLTFDRIDAHAGAESVQQVTVENKPERLQKLITQNRQLFEPATGQAKNYVTSIELQPSALPVFRKARVAPIALKSAIEAEIANLVRDGVWKAVTTADWATPIVPVVKPVGIRICGDYSGTVNPQLRVAQHPFPGFDEVFASLVGGKRFSKLDVRAAFLHLPVTEETGKILTVNTHMGLFQPTRLMYGVSSAPALWQKYVDSLFAPVSCCIVHDDILVTGTTDEEHFQRLEQIFKICRDNGIRLNAQKCRFYQSEIEFLGFKISERGIHKTSAKIDAVIKMPIPTNVTEIKSFLGMVTFYGRFVPDLASLAQPLYLLTQKDQPFVWTAAQQASFGKIKAEIASDQILIGYNAALPLVLAVDASPVGLGAVLSHRMPNGEERPIAFASRILNAAEKRYSQIDKEALAIRWGVFKFYHYVYGVRFTLVTDHQPLTHIFNATKRLPQLSATRMLHYATELRLFTFDIVYRQSKLHGNADCLSRLPMTSEKLFEGPSTTCQLDTLSIFQINQLENLPVTAKLVAAATRRDPDLIKIVCDLREGKDLGNQGLQFSLLGDVIFHGPRVYVPAELRRNILQELHEGHLGVIKMKALARSFVYWPKLDADIEELARSCQHCALTMTNPPRVSVHSWIPAEKPWERIHVDFAEFRKNILFVLVDAYSKWPEVIITTNQLTSTVITILSDLFSRYGLPRVLVSDNGPQFTALEFRKFLQRHNIIHKTSAPFHPATNGQAERYVGTVKSALRTLSSEAPSVPLAQKLSRYLFAYRRSPHVATGVSPAERFLGRTLRSALDFLRPRPQPEKQSTAVVHAPIFATGERVAIRDYANPNRPWLIGTVLNADGLLSYTVDVNGTLYRRHVNQMRRVGSSVPPSAIPAASTGWTPSAGTIRPQASDQIPSTTEMTAPPPVEPPASARESPRQSRSSASPEQIDSPPQEPPTTQLPTTPRRSRRTRRPPRRFSP